MGTGMSKVVVFGEALVDDFGTERIVGGAPFNAARHLAGFGMPPLMVTCVADDANGQLVRGEFARYGMDTAGLQTTDAAPTGRVVVERDGRGGHTFDILPRQAYDHIAVQPALEAMRQARPTVLYFGTLAQRAEEPKAALKAMLDGATTRRYLDLNLRDGQFSERVVFDSLSQADILKVNEEELAQLLDWYSHTCPPLDDMASLDVRMACAELIANFTLQGIIVTLGARGAGHYGPDGTLTTIAAEPVPELVDTVGAGDAFSAVYLYGQALGWPLTQTLERANAFAGAVCGIAGAVPGDMAFYQTWIRRWQGG
ncbi:PfkB family carbohydrate kinase [Pseudoduganella namucuonensis]|uniref:Fructokinase n=1 Tax=Pseudoduganella namucuonensis TaxID=1035707 RepID=A0A1I7LAX2_9BURK|nr:PfkB family carbohydrate kinase [Pseudoduganella namucuonensis]SFV06644.1 fructokinase [Pseudoduganella namucuonensis]